MSAVFFALAVGGVSLKNSVVIVLLQTCHDDLNLFGLFDPLHQKKLKASAPETARVGWMPSL